MKLSPEIISTFYTTSPAAAGKIISTTKEAQALLLPFSGGTFTLPIYLKRMTFNIIWLVYRAMSIIKGKILDTKKGADVRDIDHDIDWSKRGSRPLSTRFSVSIGKDEHVIWAICPEDSRASGGNFPSRTRWVDLTISTQKPCFASSCAQFEKCGLIWHVNKIGRCYLFYLLKTLDIQGNTAFHIRSHAEV